MHTSPLITAEFEVILVVAPDARERGYGSALLARLPDIACAQGAEHLEAGVGDTRPAIREWVE